MIPIGDLHWWGQLAHPGKQGPGGGYWFWSGIGSDITELAILGGLVAVYRKHRCHIQGCWRLQFHPHEFHGHPVCKKHYREPGEEQIIG